MPLNFTYIFDISLFSPIELLIASKNVPPTSPEIPSTCLSTWKFLPADSYVPSFAYSHTLEGHTSSLFSFSYPIDPQTRSSTNYTSLNVAALIRGTNKDTLLFALPSLTSLNGLLNCKTPISEPNPPNGSHNPPDDRHNPPNDRHNPPDDRHNSCDLFPSRHGSFGHLYSLKPVSDALLCDADFNIHSLNSTFNITSENSYTSPPIPRISFAISPNKVLLYKFTYPHCMEFSSLSILVESEALLLELNDQNNKYSDPMLHNVILCTLIDLFLISMVNNIDFQDLADIAHIIESKLSIPCLLLQLSSQILAFTNQMFPSLLSTLSLDGKYIALQIALCRYKHTSHCVNLDLLLQFQHILEISFFSFYGIDKLVTFSETLPQIAKTETDFSSYLKMFAASAFFRDDMLPFLGLTGAWFIELCVSILRSFCVFLNLPFTQIAHADDKYVALNYIISGNKNLSNKSIGIAGLLLYEPYMKILILLATVFFVIQEKTNIALARNNINVTSSSINNLIFVKKAFSKKKISLSNLILLLCELYPIVCSPCTTRDEAIKITRAILYYFKLPKKILDSIDIAKSLFYKHLDNIFLKNEISSDINSPSQTSLSKVTYLNKLFSKPDSNLLNVWSFYSALTYPEIFFHSNLESTEYYSKKLPAMVDVITKQYIPLNSSILVCIKCQRYSFNVALKLPPLSQKHTNNTHTSRQRKRFCICGGSWRSININNNPISSDDTRE